MRAMIPVRGIAVLMAVASSWCQPLAAQPQEDARRTIHLTDGSLLIARILEEHEHHLVLETESLGRITIERTRIASIEPAEGPSTAPSPLPAPARGRLDPDYNSVMLGPTPETLPQGSAYFRNFELSILNLGLAFTDDLNVSFGTLFPISAAATILSGGFKYRVLSHEAHGVGIAVAANGTIWSDGSLGSIIAIVGVGDRRRSLNLSVHRSRSEGETSTFFIVGGDFQLGPGAAVKLIAEYANSTNAVFEEEEDFAGFLNVGLRMFGEGQSFTLTGFRPLEETGDDFIAFPLAMYSRHW